MSLEKNKIMDYGRGGNVFTTCGQGIGQEGYRAQENKALCLKGHSEDTTWGRWIQRWAVEQEPGVRSPRELLGQKPE